MTRFFIRHPVSTWMIFTAFLVLGIYALPRLKIEAIPEVDLPSLTIETRWNSASPKAVQRSITLPIEEAVRRVHGVESVKSTSRFGRSTVEVSFRRGIDIEFARLELNEQLGSVRREMPTGAGQPQISTFVPEEFRTEDFFSFNIESPLSTNELRDRAETWIVPQVLAVEGVADARVQGGALPLIKMLLDRRKLELYRIDPDMVFTAISQLDELSGAGVIRRSGIECLVSLRTPVDLRALEQAVVVHQGGRNFRLGELAEIRSDFDDPQYFVRANGKNVVEVSVEKRSGANTVTVSRALRKALPGIRAQLPFEASFYVSADQGKDLEDKLVELVERSLVILALLFLLLALSLRAFRLTAIVIGSILFAVVISLSLFYFFRISVNFITISGLTVCFGLLLDNSILVLDSIHRRLPALQRAAEARLSRVAKLKVAAQMVVSGTHDVSFPIFATTLTTVVAFVSFIFLSGRLSLYYVPLAVSVATAMAASIFVAFAWLPVVLNQGWARGAVRKSEDGPNDIADPEEIARFVEDPPDLESPPRGLERLFHGTQRVWFVIVPLLLASFVYSWRIYETKVIKGGFWRLPDPKELFLYLEMPAGTDVRVTSETLSHFENVLLPIPEGARMQAMAFGNQSFIRVEFEDKLLETHYPTYFRELLVEQADKTGGTSVFIRGFSAQPYFKGSFGGSALNSLIRLTGYNTKTLNEIAETTLRRVEKSRRVRKARISSSERFARANQEEAVITIDRDEVAKHDLALIEVVGYIRRLLGIDTPWRMFIDGDQERVQLVYEDSESIEYSDVADKVLTSRSGEKVRLGDLVHISMEPVAGSVTREDQRYSLNINWEYVGTDKMRSSYLKGILAGIELPYGYAAEEARQEFFTQQEEEDLRLMVVLATLFILMVLGALFESASLPFLVMMAVPMALVGVFLTFWLTNTSFDSSARIGLVLLFGIVVNNAILLVSRFRKEATLILQARFGGDPEAERALFPGLRKELGGSDLYRLPAAERVRLLRRAIARGTRVRLRSILLTSGTTIVGLAPLLIHFKHTEGQDIWENLALSSIGGLASSTILLVLALPVLYYILVRIGWRLRPIARNLATGAYAGAAAGLVFALPRLAGIVEIASSGPLEILVHVGIGAFLGTVFALLVLGKLRRTWAGGLLGLLYGAFCWFAGVMTIVPWIGGDGLRARWHLAAAREMLPSGIAHLLFGLALGVLYLWLRSRTAREREPAPAGLEPAVGR